MSLNRSPTYMEECLQKFSNPSHPLARRLRRCAPEEVRRIIYCVSMTFLVGNDLGRWWWERLRHARCYSYLADPPTDFIRIVPRESKACWLIICDDEGDEEDPLRWPVLATEIEFVASILGELPYMEYCVVDAAYRWLAMENHHGALYYVEVGSSDQVNRPTITAEITFLRTHDGGRKTPPKFPGYNWMHLVRQDRGVRVALKDANGHSLDIYHAVTVIEGPAEYQLGEAGAFRLCLHYFPEDQYEDFQPGATFTAREGAKIIGHGVVKSRID